MCQALLDMTGGRADTSIHGPRESSEQLEEGKKPPSLITDVVGLSFKRYLSASAIAIARVGPKTNNSGSEPSVQRLN